MWCKQDRLASGGRLRVAVQEKQACAKACADELKGAGWAQEYVRLGGSYVIVMGSALTDREIKERRKRVADMAVELQLLPKDDPDRIRVYDANQTGSMGVLVPVPGGWPTDWRSRLGCR